MKKTYFVSLIDFNIKVTFKDFYKNIVFTKYVKGLQEARRVYNIPVSYNYNIRAFSGWKNGKQLIIKEV